MFTTVHDRIRNQPGSYTKVKSAIQAYIEQDIPVTISTTLNTLNCEELDDLINLAESLGIKKICFNGTIPSAWNRHLVLNDSQGQYLFNRIRELQEKHEIKMITHSSLFTRGGLHFCTKLDLRRLSFNPNGELFFCCDNDNKNAIIGSLYNQSLKELIQKWALVSINLQSYRRQRIFDRNMGKGFDTCSFCKQYFDEQHTNVETQQLQVSRRKFLVSSIFGLAGFALSACTPKLNSTIRTSTETLPSKPTKTVTPKTANQTNTPSPTTTNTPSPSKTVQYFDTFFSQISKKNALVDYSPRVILEGGKVTATIFLPVEIPGSHGLPFSDIYTVVVDVYTQGKRDFELGAFTGTSVAINGENISGSGEEGNLIIKWYNPVYSSKRDYIYVFKIFLVSKKQNPEGTGGIEQENLLQTVTMAGLPDMTSQVIFQNQSSPNQNSEESGEGPVEDTSCFLAGTLINFADGSQVCIENVEVGDHVFSFDLENDTVVVSTVCDIESPTRTSYFILGFTDGTELKVTSEHPIYMRNSHYEGWGAIDPKITFRDSNMRVEKLQIGDEVKKFGDIWVEVISRNQINGKVVTYNLKNVTTYNTFFANGVLVHNKGGEIGGEVGF